MQISLSDNAIRFINTAFPTFMVRADNDNFLIDAQAIAEILNAVKPQADTAPKEDNAASDVQA